ncbi:uncharacterized protein MYCFIDRAFT_184060 [Pseudocercospora fijiensis CIRAD86]|uniref:Uncharacterized protein n=1 Tax=Pseudocercospora fijiensis (strain CIRAD86) TaxID=383855 RepID=M3AJZ8_PSEFD|nr:uncharacterized protein MYCFIDRAFT_184060 [Pseudocercospora fijiensis CIRAD86]EME77762.1 hypothetical protein MYCFIDRAFT_184060 [Pseudocercospora fijiensis CIRAD86]
MTRERECGTTAQDIPTHLQLETTPLLPAAHAKCSMRCTLDLEELAETIEHKIAEVQPVVLVTDFRPVNS